MSSVVPYLATRRRAASPVPAAAPALPWVQVAAGAPYFETEDGRPWTPVGQNDAIAWVELAGLFRRRDLAGVERHLWWLRAHGVTCLRLMLEYCHGEHRYVERPVGRMVPAMVRLWDDLFALCERTGLRVLLTPFDTYFTWTRWGRHPYNRRNGGPCASRTRLLACADTRAAIRARLTFAAERWGGSGALFAWDLWNELHPAHAGNDAAQLADVVAELSSHLRRVELARHGRAHPQTVSVFGPALDGAPALADVVFRHPALDFATSHFYERGTIDAPRNTVDAARSVGRLTREALAAVPAGRPFLDSEHGPIHAFKNRRRTLPEPFDDEYFRHMQWAHLASGGAGGGMRWPNRHPHRLTDGMRRAQRALAAFLPLLDWTRFRRRNLSAELRLVEPAAAGVAAFGCGDERQAVVWLLRTDRLAADGTVRRDVPPLAPTVELPAVAAGRWRITAWDTSRGVPVAERETEHAGGALGLAVPPFVGDVALAVRAVA
jgi:hypothetical protein